VTGARVTWLAAGAAMIAACASPARYAVGAPRLMTDRGELVLITPDGRELRSANLVGSTLEVGESLVRLDAVELESFAAERVLLHHFTVVPRREQPSELCTADPSGQRWAMAVQGERGQVQLVCSSGAIGKCIRWGYPWGRSTRGPAARALHDACVRMVRADYGGDGATATRDGTRIAYCDLAGVHPCTRGEHEIEAAWSSSGATCVAKPRIPELTTLEELAHQYPQLAGHLGPACTISAAAGDERVTLFSWVPP
jgi:hypothetical protein